jgi:hypothetical protein
MRATLTLLALALAALDVEASPGGKGFGLIKNGLFKPAPFSMCPDPRGKQDGDDQAPTLVVDPAVQVDLPEEPVVAATDTEVVKGEKNKVRHAFRTMRLVQFYCANDVVDVCGLAVDNKPNCAGKVLKTCAKCFNPVNATADKACVCACERENAAVLGSCFRQHDKPPASGDSTLRDAKTPENEAPENEGGKRRWNNSTARSEVAGAMRAVRDCFKANFTQLSSPCKLALHRRHKDDLKEENGTKPTQPPASAAPSASVTSPPTTQGSLRRALAVDDVPSVVTVTSPLDVAAGSFESTLSSSTPTGEATGSTSNAAVIGGAVAGAIALVAAVATVAVLKKRRSSAADGTVATVQ